jgi:hypothetical protein
MPKRRKPFSPKQLLKPANDVANKYRERQQSAVAASRLKQGQRNHAAELAKQEPAENPMVELLRAARCGDEDAVWRADELYGSSWRVKRKAVA